jgi:hypothetical protein
MKCFHYFTPYAFIENHVMHQKTKFSYYEFTHFQFVLNLVGHNFLILHILSYFRSFRILGTRETF